MHFRIKNTLKVVATTFSNTKRIEENEVEQCIDKHREQ